MKMDREAKARLEGMDYAYRQIEKIGMEAFRKELQTRNRTGISVKLTPKEIDEASTKIKEMCLDTVCTMTIAVLHDEFGFGQKRIKQFMDRYRSKSECLMGGFVSWQDYLDTIKEELNVNISIRLNE